MSRRALGACAGMLIAASISMLVFRDGEAREERASSPDSARAQLRDAALTHARTRIAAENRRALLENPRDATGLLARDPVTCRFVAHVPGGTTPKFDCTLESGEIVRVKYGHEPEIQGEVASTRLLAALGYAVDHEYLVPRLRCYGCPPHPFVTMRVVKMAGLDEWFERDEYRDFEWTAVERKFEGSPIEDDARKGWAWWELKFVNAPAAELDAMRLLAVFLAHWDNKDDNQRLVCMDVPANPGAPCANPVLMINDLGATFGPPKVNLSQWRMTPVWSDRRTCTVSMRAMPFGGATFADSSVTDTARVQVGRELGSFSDEELRAWFAGARFPEFYASTDDAKDLDAWVGTYRLRVSQILNGGPCPH